MRLRRRALPILFVVPVLASAAACSAPAEDLGQVSQATKVCPGATVVQGVDVSHYDGTIDWTKVKASGRDFAIMKATETTTYVDPTFATNWTGAKNAGVVRGAYHFFRANVDPIAQADWFLAKLGPVEAGDLPPTLDLETTDGQTGATIAANAIKWLDHVAAKTGVKPILYTSPSFVTGTLGSPAGFETHATLWVANWGVTCPDVPTPFTKWSFWQNSSTGTVTGIPATAVDLDQFDGTLAQLKAFAIQPATTGDAGTDGGTTKDAGGSDAGGTDAASADTGGGTGADATIDDAADGAVGDDAGGSDAGKPGGDAAVPMITSTESSGGCAVSGGRGGRERALAATWAIGGLALAYATRRRRGGRGS
jgi:lysozyme